MLLTLLPQELGDGDRGHHHHRRRAQEAHQCAGQGRHPNDARRGLSAGSCVHWERPRSKTSLADMKSARRSLRQFVTWKYHSAGVAADARQVPRPPNATS